MIKYQVSLNKGVEAFGTGPSITANEIVDTADASALAREIHHLNSLIPEQVDEAVLQNLCDAAANLMAMDEPYMLTLNPIATQLIQIMKSSNGRKIWRNGATRECFIAPSILRSSYHAKDSPAKAILIYDTIQEISRATIGKQGYD